MVPKFSPFSLVSLPYLRKSFTGFNLTSSTTQLRDIAAAAATYMSNRSSRVSGLNDDDIDNLIYKLQAVLPNSGSRSRSRVQASKILEETCNHIRRLHRDVNDLTEKLSQLLSSGDISRVDADIIRNLLQQ